MTSDKDGLSFGRYLKTSRIEKGISLEDVSREIRVSEETLLLIEKEAHEQLPAAVYVKGFLRAYAKAVGADGDAAVRRYLSNCRTIMENAALDDELSRSDRRVWTRFAISLGALFCVAALTVFGESLYRDRYFGGGPSGYAPGNEKSSSVSSIHRRGGTGAEKQRSAVAEKLLLTIKAIENTRLTVTIDEHDARTYDLLQGDGLDLEASSGFKLDIENAGGVELIFNDRTLPTPGKSGQATTVRIP